MAGDLYEDRDSEEQGEYYLRHIEHMTSEGLHAKSAIAGELAHRDIQITALLAERDALQAKVEAMEKDAGRLDWLERFDTTFAFLSDEKRWLIDFRGRQYYGAALRETIDAARVEK